MANKQSIKKNESTLDKSVLNVKDIIEFANTVNIDDVKKTLDRQIEYNMAIANEGIKNNYGANCSINLIFEPSIPKFYSKENINPDEYTAIVMGSSYNNIT
jgi:L-cysteine desulfidase